MPPTPHLEKLNSTLENDKLPDADKPRVEQATPSRTITRIATHGITAV